MATAITFDYAYWIANYSVFAACSPEQGQAWFDRADVYFANDTCNQAWNGGANPGRFKQIFYMLVSHIAWLSAPRDGAGNPAATGQPASPLVGRISSAAEGSVNVSVELKESGSPSEAFFSQTEYGLMFWQATAQFRTARYVAQPTFIANGLYPAFRGPRLW